MDSAREDNSPGAPLLTAKRLETVLNETTEPNNENDPDESFHSANSTMTGGFTKKKLSETRRVDLPRINIPDMSQKRTQRVTKTGFTPQANSPLQPFMSPGSSVDLRAPVKVRVYFPHLFQEEGVVDGGTTCVMLEINRGVNADELLRQVALSQQINYDHAKETFAIWMCSSLLDLQLKPHHVPCDLRRQWTALLGKFAADATSQEKDNDAPLLYFKRNVQLSMEREVELVKHPKLVSMLWWDAKATLFAEQYYLESAHAATLAGIGFAIEYSGKEPKTFTNEFVRRNLESQLPDHLADVIRGPMMFGKTLSSGRDLDTVLETWKQNANDDATKLKALYLQTLRENCQQYGCAFFRGYIERPTVSPLKNLKRFFQAVARGDPDLAVTVAINRESITVVDSENHEIILLVPIKDCSWRKIPESEDDQNTTNEDDEITMPMLLLHFPEVDAVGRDGGPRTNILQIFGHQAALIHSMLTTMASLNKEFEQLSDSGPSSGSSCEDGRHVVNRTPSLTKCDRMCLATFVNGRCVKASGSLKKVNWGKMQAV